MYRYFARTILTVLFFIASNALLADTQTQTVAGLVSTSGWTNPDNAASIGGGCAFPTSSTASPPPVLLTDWGFSIPPGSTINGITVTAQGASTAGDNIIQLIKGGTVQGSTFNVGISGGGCPGTQASVGSASELWGLTWADTDINAANFGVSYDAQFAGRQFDGVEVTVDFTPAGGPEADIVISRGQIGSPVTAGSGAGNLFHTTGITNNGPADATNVVLNLDFTDMGGVSAAGPFGCSPIAGVLGGAYPNFTITVASIPAGSLTSCNLNLTVDSSAPAGVGSIVSEVTNVVSVPADSNATPDVNIIASDVVREVDIAVSVMESIDPVIAGSGSDNLLHTYTFTNNGPSDATGIDASGILSDPTGVIANIDFPPVAIERDPEGGTTSWAFFNRTLTAGASTQLVVRYTVNSNAPAGTDTIVSDATVDSVTEGDTNGANDFATIATSIGRESDLSITKSDSVDPVVAGTQLTYTIDYANAGPSDADNVIITDTLPAGTSYVSDTGGCVEAPAGTLTCNVGTVANGGMGQFTITVDVASSVADGASLSNTADIASDSTDPTPGNSSATEPTGVIREIDMDVSWAESIDPVVAGSGSPNLTHTLTVTNNGPSDASGVFGSGTTVAPAGVDFDGIVLIDDTESFDFEVTETPEGNTIVNYSQIDLTYVAGSSFVIGFEMTAGPSAPVGTDTIVSEFEVTATAETDTDPANDSDTIATSIERQIDLVVTKTDDPDPVVAGFELGGLEYVVTVTNNGPSDGDAVVINDPEAQWPVGVVLESHIASAGSYDGTDWTVDLPSGATETLTMTVTVGPDAVPGDDAISNTAAVTGSGGMEIIINTGDDSATELTTVLPTTATWTVSKDFLDDTGASITATLTCSSGEVTAPVQVTEGNPADLTVERFLMGPFGTTTCEVTETLPPDYFQVSASEDCEVDGVVHEDEFDCDFVNAPIRATFEVTKNFTDDNPAEVRVVIDCNTGLPLMQEATVSEFGNPFDKITFIVQDYEVGTLDCDVWEDPVPTGYQQSYEASQDPIDSLSGPIGSTADECFYTEIETGTFACDITNTLLPVEVTVNKEWIDDRPEFQNPLWVDVTFTCNAPILQACEGGSEGDCGFDGPGIWSVEQYIDPDNPGEFLVLPHWDGTTVCSATEELQSGVDQDQEDCAAIPLAPGQGGSCTFVNTRFYEGIPTLSQYGLMLLSLLMLGMGLVSFRRFS